MQCTTCRAVKAMVLCEEAIAVRASPPSATHMRAYMATVGGEPSRTQPPSSEGEEELQLPAGNPNPGGGTLQHLQADCCNLTDDELWRISTGRSHSVSWMHPQKPPTNAFGKPTRIWRSQSRWPGGHLSEGGEWVPLGQPFQPPAPAQPDGGGFCQDNLLNPQLMLNLVWV